MVTINSHTTISNLQHAPYTPLPEDPSPGGLPASSWRNPYRFQGFVVIIASIMFLMSLVAIVVKQSQEPLVIPDKEVSPLTSSFSEDLRQLPRGVAQGVSAKSSYRSFSDDQEVSYNWTNAMFSWQRTGFHFQPEKNWMNDPNGPLFHMGWYHLFFQYNPDSAVWGNITWGHAVSRDLIHWLYLPLAMVPDQWFDLNGVWTGSATILPDGKIIMLYTGDTDNYVQVQNLAYPANLSDPLLLEWIKYHNNPILVPPPGIALKDFRDPTTAWIGSDGKWRITIGSKVNKTGISLVYTTTNFITYELLDHYLHEVPGTGMWECVDFYPVSMTGSNGLDTSANGPDIKHVLKASLDDTKRDHYAIGTYYPENDTWVPDNPAEDVGIGLQVDYGRYYASKTFYDQIKERRILWGWINETDTEYDDLAKGWASLQTIPRTVVFDNKTKTNILQWPVEEVESLRLSSREFTAVEVGPGSVVPLDIGSGSQLDIIAEFEYELLESEAVVESNELESCSGGAADRSLLGPFGLLVLADQTLSEMTPVYFHVAKSSNSTFKTFFCTDESRSSKALDVFKQIYGSTVPVLDDEKLQMRVLVDHSVVESFSQGGRTVITSRIYPTEAIYGAARLFLFNNATGVNVKATLKIWHMDSAFIHYFPLEQI